MTEFSLFLPSILLAYATYMIVTGSFGPATLVIMVISSRTAGYCKKMYRFSEKQL